MSSELIRAAEVPVQPSPDVVRRVYTSLQKMITDNRERYGEKHPFVEDERTAVAQFAEATYFMYPFEKSGNVHCALPGGIKIGVEAHDDEYQVLTPSIPVSHER